MIIETPRGTPWPIEHATKKLASRAQLPGARVFDMAAASLRSAKAAGVADGDRLTLALPASWLVNSPAVSRVLRRWALEPQRATWLALIEALDGGAARWLAEGDRARVKDLVRSLGDEPTAIEAISKVLALLAPEVVPLMPAPARAFVLGESAPADAGAFCAMIDWFAEASVKEGEGLARIAKEHVETEIDGAQVLDRLLWFDSEGHRHFPPM